jgi:molybdopterin synthase catalytic subunit
MAIQAKISERSKKIIREIVHDTGESQIAVIEHAVLAYHREWRLQKLNESFNQLRQNKGAWKEELRERELLDKTFGDGLDE